MVRGKIYAGLAARRGVAPCDAGHIYARRYPVTELGDNYNSPIYHEISASPHKRAMTAPAER